MESLTPKKIVRELDKFIIGQGNAKKAVAIALRNRWRRQQVKNPLRDEIIPNNIILIGSTGVGKTEVARRIATLASTPFVKVEASKFTEVGYVGRDVESMVRDLVETVIKKVKQEHDEKYETMARHRVEERILDILIPPPSTLDEDEENQARYGRLRNRWHKALLAGEHDDREITIDVSAPSMPGMQIMGMGPGFGLDEMASGLQDMMSSMMPKNSKEQTLTVREAKEQLLPEELDNVVDMDEVIANGLQQVEENGIIFIDEVDKICGDGVGSGPDVSREGVQRDILPIVEGCTVSTKYGQVKTNHILFIAAGAFHVSKPSDLIPELQGRFPIRVEMDTLSKEDFVKILTKPEHALIKQYQALFTSEGVKLNFEKDAIKEIARISMEVNDKMENIGARRLHTVLTHLLEQHLFNIPGRGKKNVTINKEFVVETLGSIIEDEDLSRYVL